MSSNLERLRQLYDRFWREGDWSAGEDLLAPDVDWVMSFGPMTPEAQGRRAVTAFFREWLEAWDSYDLDYELVEFDDERIVVTGEFRGHGRGSGIETKLEFAQLWQFRDGLAVRQEMFRTAEEAFAAAGRSPA
jgi:ketosteroid isomerase-like protein